jgi:hypothetical protein
MALTYGQLFEHKLKELIKEAIGKQMEELALGMAVHDIGAYKERVGRIAAFRDCLDLCDEAAKEPEEKREE